MPRAATSVATSTGERASMNSSSARLRADWGRPPWIDSALIPAAFRLSASRSTPSWVRAKMIVRPGRPGSSAGPRSFARQAGAEGRGLGGRGRAAGGDALVRGRVLEVPADQGVAFAGERGREQQPLGAAVG